MYYKYYHDGIQRSHVVALKLAVLYVNEYKEVSRHAQKVKVLKSAYQAYSTNKHKFPFLSKHIAFFENGTTGRKDIYNEEREDSNHVLEL